MAVDNFEEIFDATLKMQGDKSYNEAIDDAIEVCKKYNQYYHVKTSYVDGIFSSVISELIKLKRNEKR